MRPERPSGASGYPQAQENRTEHPRAGRACAESVGDDAYAGGAGTCTDDHASARAFSYARARTDAGCGRHACEPDALT
jgi:hypothetical protein